jgi:hypothetical protein
MRSLPWALGALALGGLCCGSEDAPPPASTPPAEATPLRPLAAHESARDSLPPGHPPFEGGPRAAPPLEGLGVSGVIEVAPRFKAQEAPGVALFVIARSASDHHILAVRKEAGPHFPFSFRISGADKMMEGTDFAGPLEITARLSKSGEAMPSSGDLEGVTRGISAGAEGVRITLDTLRP